MKDNSRKKIYILARFITIMEQYQFPKELDFENLRFCLDNYKANYLYIRLKGASGGDVKVNEKLGDKKLDFKKDKSGLYMLVDSNDVFHFPLKSYDKGFTLAYERFEIKDNIERKIIYPINDVPDNPNLPNPKNSVLMNVLDNHLLEIAFDGKIRIKFHSWWDKELNWKYWTIDKPGNI